MANDSDTGEQVCDGVEANSGFEQMLKEFADRVEAAHERAVEKHEYAYKHVEAETKGGAE